MTALRLTVASLYAVALCAGPRAITVLDTGWRSAAETGPSPDGWRGTIPALARTVSVPGVANEGGPVWYWRHLNAEQSTERPFAQLVFPGIDPEARVWLNGQPLRPHRGAAECCAFDISTLLKAGRQDLLAVRSPRPLAKTPELRQGPAVGIEHQRFTLAEGLLSGVITLRNAMDNTANVWVDVEVLTEDGRVVLGPDTNTSLAPVATVPPEGWQDFKFSASIGALPPGTYRIRVKTQKNVEGIEPEWRDQLESPLHRIP